MMGTQAANTRCVRAAPTNALTSRSSELFETSLCQGKDSIRQVWGAPNEKIFSPPLRGEEAVGSQWVSDFGRGAIRLDEFAAGRG